MTLQKMVDAFIGLGSNLDNPIEHVRQACKAIAALELIELVACSPLYQSHPVGPSDQDDYINAVMHIHTRYSSLALLRQLQQIENAHGRVRVQRWGARTLDLDILLYDNQIINEPDLIVPHPEMISRGFVLYPLLDISSLDFFIPGKGRLAELLTFCSADWLVRLSL